MSKRIADGVFTLSELARASGATPSQIEAWCRTGIVIPFKDSCGYGSRRLYKTVAILDATEARELTLAGYTNRQILKRFAVHRARLAGLAEDAALVERYRAYVSTVVQLAELFGRGETYAAWLATQQAQLKRMEKALAQSGADRNQRARKVVTDAVAISDAPRALAD